MRKSLAKIFCNLEVLEYLIETTAIGIKPATLNYFIVTAVDRALCAIYIAEIENPCITTEVYFNRHFYTTSEWKRMTNLKVFW
jgi:hypothetical protein